MIEGRVARILTERELIINRGRNDGVSPGMQFEVLASESLEITDPETGQSLGALDRPKLRVEATDVYPQFTVCETFEAIDDLEDRISPSDFFRPRRRLPATLRIQESIPPLSEEESVVKVGDRVRQTAQRRLSRLRTASG
jgi:hypothetical protein